ncbi:uncharacterized protein [Penaeus vannamei]|uniref:uncharacterized protein isoform X2 n=1 Tax=Penaeus vannamei TaxID=6689 RepID=UPI00387F5598
MEQQNQEKRRGSTTCLVCGRQGGNTVVVTSVHSFVSASGTPLSDFLVKVVGEDPCYSVSEVICQQCFVLLDRLDAYQARAAEIHTHVTSRYRDTKLELLGQRQRMSELIASSLSNVQELRHGTTLNVSDELTITIVHEAMPKRRRHYRLQNSAALNHVKSSKNAQNTVKSMNGRSSAISQYMSPKFKRKRTDESFDHRSFMGKKKRKLFSGGTDALSNNNNICYDKNVKGLMATKDITDFNHVKLERKEEISDLMGDIRGSSGEEEDFSDDTSRGKDDNDDEEEEEDEEEEALEGANVLDIGNNNLEEGENDNEEESSEEESSTETDNDESTSGEEEEDDDSKVNNLQKLTGKKDEEEEEDEYEDGQSHPDSQAVPPHVAEAMLMQSPLATSLLQSFLATSLWFGSPETSKKKKTGGQAKQKQLQQDSDDLTRETLAVAAGSTKDKKKRQELKNTGQSYVNTKGKLVDAKRVWPQDCSRCPLKCNARISEEDRLRIFAEYWGLADYNLQRNYLAAHMQREEKLGPSGLLRTVILYFLSRDKDTKLQVCRQFFLKTLDVSEKASRIVLEKMVRGELGTEGGGPATPPLFSNRPHSSQGDNEKSGKEDGEDDDEEELKSDDLS